MQVVYKNKTWELNMPFMLFQSLKEQKSGMTVNIEEVTQSSYKEITSVPLRELEDYSIARNMDALKN
jgi:hypothetical protein